MKQFVSALAFFFFFVAAAQAQFTQVSTIATDLVWDLDMAELTGDSNLDVFVSRRGGFNAVFAGDGSGNFSAISQPEFTGAITGTFQTEQSVLADFNDDGWIDVMSANVNGPTELWLNQGVASPGEFTLAWSNALQASAIQSADLNGDGWADAVALTDTGIGIYMNNRDSTFTRTDYAGTYSRDIALADFTGDGVVDIAALTGFQPRTLRIIPNNTTQSTQDNNSWSGGTFIDTSYNMYNPGGVYAADFDNDGDTDAVIPAIAPTNDDGGDHPVLTFLNAGNGTFPSTVSTLVDEAVRFQTTTGDLDQDGNVDLVVAGYVVGSSPGPYASILSGDGAGGFTRTDGTQYGDRSVAIGDIDGDGYLDIVGGFGSVASTVNLGLLEGPFTVVSTADSGPGSLRWAMDNANDTVNSGAPDEITFNIPGGGTHTIQPLTELPVIIDPVHINASTQGDATCGTFGFTDRQLRVVLDGSLLPGSGDTGFDLSAPQSTIRGFVIQQTPQHAIRIGSNDGTVVCNNIGSDSEGLGATGGNGRTWTGAGVFIESSTNVVADNIVLGSSYDEIRVESGINNLIQNNFVGIDKSVAVHASPHTTPNPGNENRIGIVSGASGTVTGNVVGGFFEGILTNASAVASNNRVGIGPGGEPIANTRGFNMFNNDGTVGPGNIISNNGAGVLVQNGASGNTITQNSIFENGSSGIQLGTGSNAGITPLTWGEVYIDGAGELTLKLTAASAGTVELFQADSQVSGQGETFVSNLIPYSTPGSEQVFNLGDASALTVGVGDFLVATLTDASGNTSVFSAAVQVAADPLVVTNTNDAGPGSLRAAIDYANATPNGAGPDVITFNIPGAGPHTIATASALPGISEAVTIDGYSQPGSSANTTAAFQPFDADIRIRIDGSGQGSGNVLTVSGHSGSEIRGLVVYGAPGRAIDLAGGGHKVKGSYIGHDGVNYLGTGGIRLAGGTDDEIGGPDPADRNIIMGGVGQEPSVNSPLIQGNYFGIKANGTEIFITGRTTHSISSNQATFVEIRDNVLAGATWRDISITHANALQGPRNWSIINNRLGTDYTGTNILPSGSNGIYVQKGAHDNLFQENIIAGHAGAGILITQGDGNFSPLRNQIRRNSMFANGNPGIDLVPHAAGGTDSNDGIATPVIGDARISLDGHLVIPVSGGRDGTIEFFEADVQNEEGERYFDFSALAGGFAVVVITDPVAAGISEGDHIIATLTDAAGNTSEFSTAVQVREESFVVTSSANDGPGSLREAISLANGRANGAGPDVITFDIPGPGPHAISLTTALPTITDPVSIDACTQPGAECHLLVAALDLKVEIDGSGIPNTPPASGFVLGGSGGSQVRGLVINGFTDKGIRIPSPNNYVASNQIGTDVAGTTAAGMGGNCIEMHGGSSTGNMIEGNLISGCVGKGVGFEPGATNNTVAYNFIGTNKAATARIENGAEAIESNQADNNTVTNNTIAGGVQLNGTSDGWTITGNRIGNSFVSGVYVEFPSSRGIGVNGNSNQIGGLNPGEGNIVRGTGTGISLGSGRTLNIVQGNEVYENGIDGVWATDATSTMIQGNTIYGNGDTGVFLFGGSENTIVGNRIGLDPLGSVNGNLNGVILSRSERNAVGGTDPADRNILSGNNGAGLIIEFQESVSNAVMGNFIGTSEDGLSAAPNTGEGIRIWFGASNNTIGGTGSGEANVISGNAGHGVTISTPGDEGSGPIHNETNSIVGNLIGLGADATTAVANTAGGVLITEGSTANTLSGNTLSNNGGPGVLLLDGANNNQVVENTVSRNAGSGILVAEGAGVAAFENTLSRNSIFSNTGVGIDIQSGANNNQSAPVLLSAVRQASNLGFVSVDLETGLNFPVTLEFFQADADNEEGQTFLGQRTLSVEATSLDLAFSSLISAGDGLVATATDASGNTSAFSSAELVTQAENANGLADQIIVVSDNLVFQISSSISGITGMKAALAAAFNEWSAVSTSEAGFKVSLSETGSDITAPVLEDGVNLITQSSDSFPLSVNTLAVASKLLAVSTDGDARILNADIIFNRDLLANPQEGLGTESQPGIWDVQAVAMHEIGHTMGLRHSGISTSTMFFSIPSGKSYRSLEMDDKAWVSYRYPSALGASLGSIAGNVSDGEGKVTGGSLGGVLVVARNVATGARIHAYSDGNGDYMVPGVPAGDYEISIQPLDGFVDNIPGMVPGTVSPYLASITEYAQFAEEMWSGQDESGLETVDVAATVSVGSGEDVTGVDFTTNLDNVAPSVNGASPGDLAENVRIRPSIAVTFSEPIVSPALSGLSITLLDENGASISGIVQVPNAPNVVATFDLPLGESLAYFKSYTIRVSGAEDEKDNVQSGVFTSTFTTRPSDLTAPQLVGSTPGNGDVDVAPSTTISLAFDEPMNFASIESGATVCVLDGGSTCGASVPGTWSFPRTTLAEALPQWVAVFRPSNMLMEGATYRVSIAETVRDQAAGTGNEIGSASSYEFSTVPDDVPSLIVAGPEDGSVDQSVRLSVFADFSEPMVLPEVNGERVGVTLTGSDSGPVAGTVEVINDGKRIVFRPNAPLAFFDSFTASFAGDIKDATGNAIQAFELKFDTAAQPTTVTVKTVSPLVAIPGSIVVFSGEGFNADPKLNTIQFTGASGTLIDGKVESSTLSTLSAVVPDGAISGPVTITSGGQSGSVNLELYNVIPLVDPAVSRYTAESAPRDVEVTPDGGTALVTNSGAGTVSILNVEDGSLRASIMVGDSPLKVAINPDGTRAYVTNFGSNDISVLDITNVNSPTLLNTISVGLNPFGLAISPDGKRLYVAEYTSSKITIIDIEEGSSSYDRAIARIGVEANERDVEEFPDGGVTKIGAESNPRDLEVSPDGGSLFFTTETLGLRVLLLDENGSADENAATRRITSETNTRDVELSPDGGLVFVTTLAGALEAYRIPPDLNSTSSFQAVARLGEESNSREVEISPDGGLIYVTNFEQGLVQVYSITSLYTPSSNSATGGFALSFAPVTSYSVGENPEAVVFSAAAQVALVANSGSDNVTVISFENDITSITDSDGDGLGDAEELVLGTDPAVFDTDGDGLGDGQEINETLTSPLVVDSDVDGLSDGDEVNTYLTNPNEVDTDEDGLSDGDEVLIHLTLPLVADSDVDGLSDGREILEDAPNDFEGRLDATLIDSDGNGTVDGDEDFDADGRLNKDDAFMYDGSMWFNNNAVHDGREESVESLTTIVEELTGEAVVIPDENAGGVANLIEKGHRGDVKVNPYEDEFTGELPVEAAKGGKSKKSDKSDKSKKSSKSPEEVAEQLYDALVGLAWNANPDKWITTVRPVEEYGNEIFTRDRNAVKAIDKVIDDIEDEEMAVELARLAEMLTDAAYDAASHIVDNAVCDGKKGCDKKVKKAEDYLEDAREEREEGDLDKAIEDMRKAWNQAVKYYQDPNTDSAGKQDNMIAESEDIAEEVAFDLPLEFELKGNYPNPFNPSTTIEFALPEAANVNLVVFDMVGRRVQVLVNGSMAAGRHTVRFDASRLPSGMYLYRIQAGQHQQVRTMMLIK